MHSFDAENTVSPSTLHLVFDSQYRSKMIHSSQRQTALLMVVYLALWLCVAIFFRFHILLHKNFQVCLNRQQTKCSAIWKQFNAVLHDNITVFKFQASYGSACTNSLCTQIEFWIPLEKIPVMLWLEMFCLQELWKRFWFRFAERFFKFFFL